MDLFGPCRVTSLGGKNYAYVMVDDYSRYIWVLFFAHKNDSFEMAIHCDTYLFVSL